ncbi:MAG: NADH-quinone oxidoreductase subunit N, partial [Chloroflexi bacterium]|nr:NADH-quinone oxidoreductase subunit N [Chloroflexota bacterium]
MQVDFTLLIPEFMLAGLGVLVLVVDFSVPWASRGAKNGVLAALTVLGLAVTFVVTLWMQWDTHEILYEHLIYVDRYALLFKALAMAIGAAVVLISMEYVHTRIRHAGEFYALIVFAVLGAVLMAGAAELLTAYIAIELLAFCLYVLVALSRGDSRSGEAAVKYILLGAISSAVMLFGIALIYGAIGETGFRRSELLLEAVFGPTVALGLGMFVAGLGFKLSMAPFHLWAPDVYEGAPTPVTALVSVLSKAAAFALTLRFLAEAGNATLGEWQLALAILAALTMTVG